MLIRALSTGAFTVEPFPAVLSREVATSVCPHNALRPSFCQSCAPTWEYCQPGIVRGRYGSGRLTVLLPMSRITRHRVLLSRLGSLSFLVLVHTHLALAVVMKSDTLKSGGLPRSGFARGATSTSSPGMPPNFHTRTLCCTSLCSARCPPSSGRDGVLPPHVFGQATRPPVSSLPSEANKCATAELPKEPAPHELRDWIEQVCITSKPTVAKIRRLTEEAQVKRGTRLKSRQILCLYLRPGKVGSQSIRTNELLRLIFGRAAGSGEQKFLDKWEGLLSDPSALQHVFYEQARHLLPDVQHGIAIQAVQSWIMKAARNAVSRSPRSAAPRVCLFAILAETSKDRRPSPNLQRDGRSGGAKDLSKKHLSRDPIAAPGVCLT